MAKKTTTEKRPATEWQNMVSRARKAFPHDSFPQIQQRAKNAYYGILSLEDQKKRKTRVLPSHRDVEAEKRGEFDEEGSRPAKKKKTPQKFYRKTDLR